MQVEFLIAVLFISLGYVLKRMFWPVDAPPPVKEDDDETQIDNKIHDE
jgi:hypothetical protein